MCYRFVNVYCSPKRYVVCVGAVSSLLFREVCQMKLSDQPVNAKGQCMYNDSIHKLPLA